VIEVKRGGNDAVFAADSVFCGLLEGLGVSMRANRAG
jgi:hypothetical protein